MVGRKGRFINPQTERLLRQNLYKMSPKELQLLTGVSLFTIYRRLKGKTPVPDANKKEPEVKKVRPPSNYSNHRPYDNI